MIEVDEEKCSGCGACSQVCPHRLLTTTDQGARLEAGDCMECGHCQAICPVGAITGAPPLILGLQNIDEHCDAIAPGGIDPAQLVQLMRSRRSYRKYTDQPVELTVLEDLVRIGTTAPSGTNSQGWNFTILPTREDVAVLGELVADFFRDLNTKARNPLYRFLAQIFAGNALGRYYHDHYDSVSEALREWDHDRTDRLFHGAPAVILVTSDKSASCPGEDALLATQNMLLGAHGLGLGSCLIGYVVEAMRHNPRIREAMGIGRNEEVYSVIALGYPAITYQKVTGRQPVRPRVLHLGTRQGRNG